MGTGLTILVFSVLGVAMLVALIAMVRTGKPIRFCLGSLLQGICALAAVNIVGIFSGVSLGLSWFSVAGCAAFGVPGVITMLLMRCIAL
jgi:inhibitor of the pro-sigma K processing machinery